MSCHNGATRPAKDITRRDVLDLTDGIMDRSPVSANRVLSLIRRLYNWAVERGIVEANPAAGIKPPHREHPRDRILTDDEIRALWAAWDAMGYPFGTIQQLLLLTAQRRGEVAAMRWDQMDLRPAYMASVIGRHQDRPGASAAAVAAGDRHPAERPSVRRLAAAVPREPCGQ